MNAIQLVQKFGQKLVGNKVNTPAAGSYPGGVAKVIQIAPDQKAPDIVFQVHLPHWGEIGVLEHEQVSLLIDKLGRIQLHEHWRN